MCCEYRMTKMTEKAMKQTRAIPYPRLRHRQKQQQKERVEPLKVRNKVL